MDETIKKHFIDNNNYQDREKISNEDIIIKDNVVEIIKQVIFDNLTTIDFDDDELCNEIDHIAEETADEVFSNLFYLFNSAIEKVKGIQNGNL